MPPCCPRGHWMSLPRQCRTWPGWWKHPASPARGAQGEGGGRTIDGDVRGEGFGTTIDIIYHDIWIQIVAFYSTLFLHPKIFPTTTTLHVTFCLVPFALLLHVDPTVDLKMNIPHVFAHAEYPSKSRVVKRGFRKDNKFGSHSFANFDLWSLTNPSTNSWICHFMPASSAGVPFWAKQETQTFHHGFCKPERTTMDGMR